MVGWVARVPSPMSQAILERTPKENHSRSVGLAAVFGLLVALLFAIWRENPAFWRGEHLHLIWLRGLVKSGYYPLLATDAVLLALLTRALARSGPVARPATASTLIAAWLAFAAIVGYSLANNLENLWKGRPLHWHRAAPMRTAPNGARDLAVGSIATAEIPSNSSLAFNPAAGVSHRSHEAVFGGRI